MFASRKSVASALIFLAVLVGTLFGIQTGVALADTHWSAGTTTGSVVLASTSSPTDTHWSATSQLGVEDTHW